MDATKPPAARIEHDTTRCTGTGMCEATAPSYFEVRDDGTLSVLEADVDPDDLATVRDAVAACPTEALRLVRE
jgi:ferredoxin